MKPPLPHSGDGLEIPAVTDLPRRVLGADPEGLALISADVRWSWRDLDEQSARLVRLVLQTRQEIGVMTDHFPFAILLAEDVGRADGDLQGSAHFHGGLFRIRLRDPCR